MAKKEKPRKTVPKALRVHGQVAKVDKGHATVPGTGEQVIGVKLETKKIERA